MRDPFPTITSGNYRPQALCLRVKTHRDLVAYRRCELARYESNGSENNFVVCSLQTSKSSSQPFNCIKESHEEERGTVFHNRHGLTSEMDGYYIGTLKISNKEPHHGSALSPAESRATKRIISHTLLQVNGKVLIYITDH